MIGGAEIFTRRRLAVRRAPQPRRAAPARRSDEMGRFVAAVLGSTEDAWKEIFSRERQTYRAPVLVLYRGADAGRLMRRRAGGDGAVLLPGRPAIYLDTSFFREIATRFRGCTRQGVRILRRPT